MKNLVFVILMILMNSCSNINTDSREYYQGKKMRHGIIPIEATSSNSMVKRVVDKESVKRGKEVYAGNCMSCHGSDGEKVKHVSLSSLSKSVPNFRFYLLVSQSKDEMPGWKNTFTKQEIRDLENYLYSM